MSGPPAFMLQTTRVYKVERRQVPKVVALRKKWKKFGHASDDGPGPNRSTTIVADEVFLQLTTNKEVHTHTHTHAHTHTHTQRERERDMHRLFSSCYFY